MRFPIATIGPLVQVEASPEISERDGAGANLSYSERAPETSELYSNGPHHGSETFDVGNPSLNTESAIGLEIILRRKLGNVTGQLSAFWTQFDDYVYPNKTPVWDFDLGKLVPHMVYTAADADFRGLEAEIDWRMMGNPGHAVHVSVYGDLLEEETKRETPICPEFHLQGWD